MEESKLVSFSWPSTVSIIEFQVQASFAECPGGEPSAMPRILVIDDRADVRRAIEAILKARGHVSRSADGGCRGLELLRDGDFDAVVIDIFMPDLDGISAIQLMRNDFPNLPIIAISGQAVSLAPECGVDFLDMAVKLGASASLHKPFTPSQLMDALETAIRSQRTFRQAAVHLSDTRRRGGEIEEPARQANFQRH